MNYETMMKTLLGAVRESLPIVDEQYEHLAKEYDTEFHAYFDSRANPDAATGDPAVALPSPHILFHKPCFEAIMKIVKKLRDKSKYDNPFMMESLQLVAHVEDHCVQLAHPEQHQLKPVHAATNRAIWQGANALVAMAMCLRPRAADWMQVANTWSKGTAAVVTCIAVLRVRRNHPDELLFNDPERDMHPLEFANAMMEKQAETTQIITDLFAYRPA